MLGRPSEPPAHLELDDLQVLLLEREQLHEPVLGHLVLDQAQDQIGRRDRRLDAEQLEVLEVARVIDPGDDPLQPYFSLATWQIRMLSSSSR